MKGKYLVTSNTVTDVIRLFFFVTDTAANEAEVPVSGKICQASPAP
jgi:hypothetical protein